MRLQSRWVFGTVALLFLVSVIFMQSAETVRGTEVAGALPSQTTAPAQDCVGCHRDANPGIVLHWEASRHAEIGIACIGCHQASADEADSFQHYGQTIATVVTPRDCGVCHAVESQEFAQSHHAKAGDILASLDNFLAETVEGVRMDFSPHSPTPGMEVEFINGFASANSGCQQCHGSKVALLSTTGELITVDELQPDENGKPTNQAAMQSVARDELGQVVYAARSWPNTGIGRLNLDGSIGACSACHSRHDFSRRRARQPENCGKCHLGPDHPQKEIYEESKHGVAYRDLRDEMNLDAIDWVLGVNYSAAPTCATCHMSGNARNGGRVTHDPGERISWTNRPPVSVVMDTDANHTIVTETDPTLRRSLITDTAVAKRDRMKEVCSTCHTPNYIDGFYEQYDSLVLLYNEKFGKPGQEIMKVLLDQQVRTPTQFDEEIEWTWFFLWHHEGRRARHGASMMAPDYTHWHGMYEVADRFYMSLIPQAREMSEHAAESGNQAAADAIDEVVDEILQRPEHVWFVEGAEGAAERIRLEMLRRYGGGQ